MCTQQNRIEFNGLDEDIALSHLKEFEVQGSEILNIDWSSLIGDLNMENKYLTKIVL